MKNWVNNTVFIIGNGIEMHGNYVIVLSLLYFHSGMNKYGYAKKYLSVKTNHA